MTIKQAEEAKKRYDLLKIQIMERLQKDMHQFVEDLISKNNAIGYQDAVNVWILEKLAELEMNKSDNRKIF
jgi:hypothetical protein